MVEAAPTTTFGEGALRGALRDSRQRWRDLAALAADFIFETDEWGRLILAEPDPALGWSATGLLGQPARRLLADPAGFDPFRITTEIRSCRVWLRRGDGGQACLLLAAIPILAANGCFAGVRGLGIDMTELDTHGERMASALSRGEARETLLRQTSREVLAPRMMRVALASLIAVLGAEGSAVALDGGDGAPCRLAHVAGEGAEGLRATISSALPLSPTPSPPFRAEGRSILLAACATRFGAFGAITVWRAVNARG